MGTLFVHRHAVLLFTAFVAAAGSATGADQASPADESAEQSETWVTSIAGPTVSLVGGTDRKASPGQYVAATALGLLLRPSDVVLFDPSEPGLTSEPGLMQSLYQHPAAVWQVVLGAGGKLVASADYQGNLFIHDLVTSETTKLEGILQRWCQSLLISPDGASVIAGNEAGQVILVDLQSGEVTKTVELDGHAVTAIALAPDQSQLAAADGAGHVHLLSWPGLEPKSKIQISKESAWCVSYGSGGETLLVGCGDRKLYRCTASSDAKPVTVLQGSDWLTRISVSPAGDVAVGEIGGKVHLFPMPDSDEPISPTTINAPSGVWSIHWSDASTLLIGTRKHGIQAATRSWKWLGE